MWQRSNKLNGPHFAPRLWMILSDVRPQPRGGRSDGAKSVHIATPGSLSTGCNYSVPCTKCLISYHVGPKYLCIVRWAGGYIAATRQRNPYYPARGKFPDGDLPQTGSSLCPGLAILLLLLVRRQPAVDTVVFAMSPAPLLSPDHGH